MSPARQRSPERTGSSRFARRAWRARLLRFRPLLVAFGLVVVVGLGTWVVFWSSWLTAAEVRVAGQQTVDEQRVVAAAQVDLGTPLVRLDLDAIRARVAALPPVASVSVHRSWPHTVSIDIAERQPVAAVEQRGSWWVMDADGVVFRKTGNQQPGLPEVAVRASAPSQTRAEAARVVASLPADLLSAVTRVSAGSMDSITLQLRNGREVRWGSSAESPRKVEVLAVLLDRVEASVYDVRVPEQPTTAQ